MALRPSLQVVNLGVMRYAQALKIQECFVKKHKESCNSSEKSMKNVLLLVEHPPVYTVGIRTENYPLSEEERLTNLGADFHRTNRGGLITFHGLGQLVVYPILNLLDFQNMSVRCYVNNLEESIIRLCANYEIKGERSPHTGVWVENDKICAMGCHVSNRITSHGLAFNCNPNLSWYNHIVPCGIPDRGVTSLSKLLGKDIGVKEVIPHMLNALENVFESKCKPVKDYTEVQSLLGNFKKMSSK